MPPKTFRSRSQGQLRALLLLGPFLAVLAFIAGKLHYHLPVPSTALRDAATGQPCFSESRALEVVHHLADTIGYRIVGTQEMVQSEAYLLGVVEDIKGQLDSSDLQGFHEVCLFSISLYFSANCASSQIEIWHQQQPGSHLLDFMDKKVWKVR
jgi:hypothetical protein